MDYSILCPILVARTGTENPVSTCHQISEVIHSLYLQRKQYDRMVTAINKGREEHFHLCQIQ